MVQRWVIEKDDPRAPPSEVWAVLSEVEREHVVASLPSEFDLGPPPEGDRHFDPKVNARKTLERYFRRLGRKAYVGSELAIYYPGERVFAPDVFVVLDVEPHPRERWVVDHEGRGLDWVLEIHVSGDRRKDHLRNVEWFSRLGIPECFLFDRGRLHVSAWGLSPGAAGPNPLAGDREGAGPRERSTYAPVLPERGRFVSRTLGLEVGVVDERLRFFSLDAELPEVDELIEKLERAVNRLERRADEEVQRAEEARRAEEEARRAEEEARRAEEEARRAEEEARRAEEEARRAEEEAARRAESAEAEVAALRAELARLKSGKG
jgi:hypothetical protein